MSQIMSILQNSVYAFLVLFFIYAAKLIADWRTKDIDDDFEIEENSNLAIGIRRAGLYLGIAIGMTGPLLTDSAGRGFISDIGSMIVDGVVVVLLLFAARFLGDKYILNTIKNDDEAKDGNVAVGIVEFGIYVATGFILNGSFSGEGGGLIGSMLFFILGQVALVTLFKMYKKSVNFGLMNEIEEGNSSAGVAAAGILISFGIILRSSLLGAFTGWIDDVSAFFISALLGTILLIFIKKISEKLFLPHTNFRTEIKRDKNVAALILTESVIISFALVISSVI